MVAVYVCSTDTRAGKTMVVVGLARKLARAGQKVGYFKPIGFSSSDQNGTFQDADAAFVRQALSLNESTDILSPVTLASNKTGEDSLGPDSIQRIRDAFAAASQNKDVTLVEGQRSAADGASARISDKTVNDLLGAKALLVARYRGDATLASALALASAMGKAPTGVIVNGVPSEQISYARQTLVSQFESNRLSVLGILPLERDLLGGSVGDLAGFLGGAVLCCTDKLNTSVDSVMIGARSFDSGLGYFSRKKNKVLVARSEKPDIQLAALQTETSCLVSTGGTNPSPTVIRRAMEVDVPVIQVTDDTTQTVERIEQFLSRVRFHQLDKIRFVERLIDANVDFNKLSTAFGLSPR